MTTRVQNRLLKFGMGFSLAVAAGAFFIMCQLVIPEAYGEPGEYGPCAPCKAEFVDQTDFDAPDGECEHGWAHDADCTSGADCCDPEFGGPGCTGGANECKCTTCNPAWGCEAMQKRWTVWCGRSGTGTCVGLPSVADPANVGPIVITQKRKPANAAAGCATVNNNPWTSEPCGGFNMMGSAGTKIGLACKSKAGQCVNDGAPINGANQQRQKCNLP